jgi:hypothetical protein
LSAIYRVPLEGGLVPIAPKALAAPALWQDGSWILGDYSSPVAFTSVASAPEGMLYTTDGRGRLFYRDTIGRFAQRALRGDGKGGVADPRLENMAFDGMGNAYAADLFNIYKIAPDGEVSKLTAQAHSQELSGIAATAAGTIYVSAPSDGVVYRVTPQGQLEVYAGAVGDRRHADGGRLQARFASPVGLALDDAGNLYVGDADSHTVRKISLDGGFYTGGATRRQWQ